MGRHPVPPGRAKQGATLPVMVTVQVTLREETYERLKAQADALGLEVAAMLAADVEARVPAGEISEEVQEIIERQAKQYKDVFDRLAQ